MFGVLLDHIDSFSVVFEAQQLHEALVVSDHDELEVVLFATFVDDFTDGLRKAFNVGAIQVCRRLVQRQDSTVTAKGLS